MLPSGVGNEEFPLEIFVVPYFREKLMKCTSCRNDEMIKTTTTYFSSTPTGYIIIENVPCQKCPQCGEEVFPASVMERIDHIIAHITTFSNKACIMEYNSAA